MIELALWLGISALYVFVGMGVYRVSYKNLYTDYLRWRNEAPKEVEKYYGDDDPWDSVEKPREWFSFYGYLNYVSDKYPTYSFWLAVWWPFVAVFKPVRAFLHPEVKIPDQVKIKELENL